jgi:hypothetical protein
MLNDRTATEIMMIIKIFALLLGKADSQADFTIVRHQRISLFAPAFAQKGLIINHYAIAFSSIVKAWGG